MSTENREVPDSVMQIIRDFAKSIEPLPQRDRDAVILAICSGGMLAHVECGHTEYAAQLVLTFMQALMEKSPTLWMRVERLMAAEVKRLDPELHEGTEKLCRESRERRNPKAKA